MKIISEFRDYYDHEINYFDRDNSVTFNRGRGGRIATAENVRKEDGDWLSFHICGEKYSVLFLDGKFHFEYTEIFENKYNKNPLRKFHPIDFTVFKTPLNEQLGIPVLLQIKSCGDIVFPRLADFSFGSFIPSRKMYLKIYNFLKSQGER